MLLRDKASSLHISSEDALYIFCGNNMIKINESIKDVYEEHKD